MAGTDGCGARCVFPFSTSYPLPSRSYGVCHVVDAPTGRPLLSQRVIWAEPLPQRAVEGNERFLLWRRDSGLEGAVSKEMIDKGQDTLRTSAALAEFILSLPPPVLSPSEAPPAASVVAIDADTGLIAINCSASSGAICIHEPKALRRVNSHPYIPEVIYLPL